MQVILKKNVAALGRAGEIVRVTDAYARNYLLPNKLAGMATAAAIATQSANLARQAATTAAQNAERVKLRALVDGAAITVTAPASPTGRLFAAIKSDQIFQTLERKFQVKITGANLEPDHYKVCGDISAQVRWPELPPATIHITIGHA